MADRREKVLITAALPYANGTIHFGHIAGVYLPADCFARIERLLGKNVLFLSGSDQYGVAVTMSAERAGREPKEHVELFHKQNSELFKKLGISFDHYSKTTCKEHAPLVQEFFLELVKKGYIEKRETEQLYSESEGKFLADRYVEGTCPKCGFDKARGDECIKCGGSYEATDLKSPRSAATGSKLVLKKTEHWFLLCEKFKEKLLKWIGAKGWRPNVINFVTPYIEDLRPRAISRDLNWGVPLPIEWTKGKVFYVWFDAPIGYISAAKEWADITGKPDAWEKYWLDPKTKYVQFLGKDNIVFHAAIFPAMVMGQEKAYKQVDDLVASEFLNLEGKQFSKSGGWFIDLEKFLAKYPVDTLRYTLAANSPETQDSEFSWQDFQMRVNTELLGKFGNFVNRTLTFVHSRMEQKIPEPLGYDDETNNFLAEVDQITQKVLNAYRHYQLRKATQGIMELADLANAYFDHSKPWEMLKTKERLRALDTMMYAALSAVKRLALLAYPVIPSSADKIWRMLGLTGQIESKRWEEVANEELIPNNPLPKPELLFKKVEDEMIAEEMEKLKNAAEPRSAVNLKSEIAFDEFMKLDLRVAEIKTVENVPKSNKLLKLTVDLGFEKRTIVSGIAKHFPNGEDLVGKRVVVVANLKPTKIMGVQSEGMILAAGEDKKLELPVLNEAPPGSPVC